LATTRDGGSHESAHRVSRCPLLPRARVALGPEVLMAVMPRCSPLEAHALHSLFACGMSGWSEQRANHGAAHFDNQHISFLARIDRPAAQGGFSWKRIWRTSRLPDRHLLLGPHILSRFLAQVPESRRRCRADLAPRSMCWSPPRKGAATGRQSSNSPSLG
jgi:hypothetical protein